MTIHQVHVIEDDEAVANAISFLLRTMGYEVATYPSALRFLERWSENPQGCVITDVNMPELNGIALTAQLRTLDIRLPVIVISGRPDAELASLAHRAGAAAFLSKPFDDDMLLEALAQLPVATQH
jgi:two-component system response regulator FixJ